MTQPKALMLRSLPFHLRVPFTLQKNLNVSLTGSLASPSRLPPEPKKLVMTRFMTQLEALLLRNLPLLFDLLYCLVTQNLVLTLAFY